jgi:hypothetical protein
MQPLWFSSVFRYKQTFIKNQILMKKLLFAFVLVVSAAGLKAQENEIQTLFGSGTRISGFGGPTMSFTSINGEFAHMMGGGGGVLLGNFFIGGYGEGLTNSIVAGGNRISFGHGGFWTGYSFMADRALHPCLSTQMGWGNLSQRDDGHYNLTEDNIFVINPAIELEMNFTRFFRLGVGAHYRFVSGVNTSTLTNSDFSGPGAFLSFKFGWF